MEREGLERITKVWVWEREHSRTDLGRVGPWVGISALGPGPPFGEEIFGGILLSNTKVKFPGFGALLGRFLTQGGKLFWADPFNGWVWTRETSC